MLDGWVHQLKLIAIKSNHHLRINSIMRCGMEDSQHTQKSIVENYVILLGYISHFGVWLPYKWKKKKTYWYIFIWYVSETYCNEPKWIIYNNIEGKILWGRQNELTSNCTKSYSSYTFDIVYVFTKPLHHRQNMTQD